MEDRQRRRNKSENAHKKAMSATGSLVYFLQGITHAGPCLFHLVCMIHVEYVCHIVIHLRHRPGHAGEGLDTHVAFLGEVRGVLDGLQVRGRLIVNSATSHHASASLASRLPSLRTFLGFVFTSCSLTSFYAPFSSSLGYWKFFVSSCLFIKEPCFPFSHVLTSSLLPCLCLLLLTDRTSTLCALHGGNQLSTYSLHQYNIYIRRFTPSDQQH